MEDEILIITNENDLHADFLIEKFKERDLPFFRFNTERLNESNLSYRLGDIEHFSLTQYGIHKLKDWQFRSVWYRRPEKPKHTIFNDVISQKFVEIESKSALESIVRNIEAKIWVNHPTALYACHSKLLQLVDAQKFGLLIPNTLVTNEPLELQKFYKEFNQKIVYKPIRDYPLMSESGKGIFTSQIRPQDMRNLESLKHCPILVQEEISKKYDIRVTVVGNIVFSAIIHSQMHKKTKVDWRKGDVTQIQHEIITLPETVEEKCKMLTTSYGLNFSAIDLIQDIEGNFVFLELNRNGQWAWLEHLTGARISDAFINLLKGD